MHAAAELIKERENSRGGWLSRPAEAIQAVRSQHSLQSVNALKLFESRSNGKPALVWNIPMPDVRNAPKVIEVILELVRWLPIHGRDQRYGGVALAWALAPLEGEFLCKEAAKIRTVGRPGLLRPDATDRVKECSALSKSGTYQ
jgi:hypothetical protein